MHAQQHRIDEYRIEEEPYYLSHRELAIAETALHEGAPLLLKGPTSLAARPASCSTRPRRLHQPLVTVSCRRPVDQRPGRPLPDPRGEAVWNDGPDHGGARRGRLCYLDEIVEARKDTTVVIHPLADDRRQLPIEKRGELLTAPPEFMLAVSYNPGYQSVLKDLKASTRQRFIALSFDYPEPEREVEIVCREGQLDRETARLLVKLAGMTRTLKDSGLAEGASTRLLIQVGKLIGRGIPVRTACRAAISEALTDDSELLAALDEMVTSLF